MQKYLKQLIADLYAAQRPEINWAEAQKEISLEKHFEDIERYVSGEMEMNSPKFSQTCGIAKEVFPPSNKWDLKQIRTINKAIHQLLFSWNISVDFPKTLPSRTAYELLVSVFDQQVMIVETGDIGIDFCDAEPKGCVFGKHCSCIELHKEWDDNHQKVTAQFIELTKKLKKIFSDNELNIKLTINSTATPEPYYKVKTIGEWLGISPDEFPPAFELIDSKLDMITNELLKLIHPKDEMLIWLKAVDSTIRYKRLVEHLSTKIWRDDNGIFFYLPLSSEEITNIISPLDQLPPFNFDHLGYDDDSDEDEDLPF